MKFKNNGEYRSLPCEKKDAIDEQLEKAYESKPKTQNKSFSFVPTGTVMLTKSIISAYHDINDRLQAYEYALKEINNESFLLDTDNPAILLLESERKKVARELLEFENKRWVEQKVGVPKNEF